MNKVCTKCKVSKPLAEYHKTKSSKDGLQYRCKSCVAEYNRSDKIKAYQKVYNASPQGRQRSQRHEKTSSRLQKRYAYNRTPARSKIRQDYRDRNLDKVKAWRAMSNSIRDGKFPPASSKSCNECGRAAQEYHHWSYAPEHRFDVVPLCTACHGKTRQIS